MKFTDEELSRVLGEAEADQLQKNGGYEWCLKAIYPSGVPCGCINQAAYNERNPVRALDLNPPAATMFDRIRPMVTIGCPIAPGDLLHRLEGAGLA